jgi:hypothetical protein
MERLLSTEESKEDGERVCGVTVGVVEAFGGSAIGVSECGECDWLPCRIDGIVMVGIEDALCGGDVGEAMSLDCTGCEPVDESKNG